MKTQNRGAGTVTTSPPTYTLDRLTYFHLEILHDVLARERATIVKALAATSLPDDHRRVRDKVIRRDRIAEILAQIDAHKSAHVARVKAQLTKPPFTDAEAPAPVRYTCVPKANDSTIIGCGAAFVGEPDKEGLVDCPNCGIWFPASEGKPVPWIGKPPARGTMTCA